MNVQKTKPPVSPPAANQLSQQQPRNIVATQRGQTPPIRADYSSIVDHQQGGYQHIQPGFTVPANLTHDMNQQTVTSGHMPPRLPQQQPNMYQPNMRQQYYAPQQAQIRSSQPYIGSSPQPNQTQMFPMMYQLYQPGVMPYGSQRMPGAPYAIPSGVQQPYQQANNQQYANAQQGYYNVYYPQQMQVTQTRPASAPNQNPPVKRSTITIVDPNTKKDVTDEILHHKSTPPSSSGTPVSFPVSNSPPQQDNEIRALFASKVAAQLKNPPVKLASGNGENNSETDGTIHSQSATEQAYIPKQHKSVPIVSSDEAKDTSVDPPTPPMVILTASQTVTKNAQSENSKENIPNKTKAAIVSANLSNDNDAEPQQTSRPATVSVSEAKITISSKQANVTPPHVLNNTDKPEMKESNKERKSTNISVQQSVSTASVASVASDPEPIPVSVIEDKPVEDEEKKNDVEEETIDIVTKSVVEKEVQESKGNSVQDSVIDNQKDSESKDVNITVLQQENTEEAIESDKSKIPQITISKDVEEQNTEDNETVNIESTVEENEENEKIPEVEVKIEDVDVSKENAKNNEMTTEALNSETKKPEMQLQYKYKADQWSPVNTEGKKIYDREFLLQMQFSNNSVSKPQDLPNLPEIILDKPVSMSKGRDYENSAPDFTPGFFQTLPGRSGSSAMMKKRNSQQGQKNEPVKKIIKTVSISQDIKLHKADNAWEPGRKKDKAEIDEDQVKTDEIYKKVKSILNKLTPQKFQTLLKQMHDLAIDTETRLKGVTDLIFEKAVSEPAFSVAYANMCRYLMQLKVPSDTKPGEKVNFRVILLTKCQREFEKDKDVELDLEARQKKIDEATSEDEKKTLQEEMEIAATTARRRSTGNIRFIGELFKLKMLTENIMHDCVFKLLRSKDEENLECLCRLLTTIGKELDTEKAKPRVDQYFQKMQKIVSERKTSSRVRFMLQDVIDLRQCNWVPRREDYNPKTIDQIHKEAAKESAQKAFLLTQSPMPPPAKQGGARDSRDGRSRGGPQNRGQNNQRNDDGWNTVSSKQLRSIDLTKMKISKPAADENIMLGPGGGSSRFAGWGRGSSGGGHGTKSSSQEGESPASNAPANRFSGLRGEDNSDMSFGRGISPAHSDSRNRATGGFGRGRLTPRSSQELDRERAIASVRNMTGRTTPTSSNPASRDSSRTRLDKLDNKPVVKQLSEEEMEKKTKTIIDEYLHINDIKEACTCVSEINNPSNVHLFVEFSINHVLERSNIARQQTGHLHHELISKSIISVDSYLKGLNQTLEIAEDMEIDIPKIWQYLGELIAPMIQDGSVPLNFLKQVCEPLKPSGKSGILVAEVLHFASQRLGHKKVASLWKNSGLVWSDFVPVENVKQFLIDKDLHFTVADDSAPSTPVDSVSFETVQEQLLVRSRDNNCDNEHIFDWIEANIPEDTTKSPRFIRTLMTAVCKSALAEGGHNYKVNAEVIKLRQSLLLKYLDNQQEFEIQALYALQALVNELQHPSGVLRTFFDTLYDEEIISEDAFNQWDISDDPAEQEGKGVARKAVVQFFAWLNE